MTRMTTTIAGWLALALTLTPALTLAPVAGAAGVGDEIPARPEALDFGPLDWQVPKAGDYRHELPGGIPVYVVEDRSLPLVDVGVELRIGSFLEASDEVGLARLTAALMRKGGAGESSAAELDERLDALAANVSVWIGDTQGSASLNCLSAVLDECLEEFFAIQRQPRFDQSRLELEKSNVREQLSQRNDDPRSIENREWAWLLYGDHFSARQMTTDTLAAIERDDLVAFHAAYWRPENMVLTVTGDVDAREILPRLAQYLADWPGEGKPVPWPPPEAPHRPEPGVYYVDRDVPQSRVSIGQRAFRYDWNSPDLFPLMVMNEILGGGGFSSRLTQRIRSDEGLAYSAGSRLTLEPWWVGDFEVFFQTKNPTAAFASAIAFEEVRRIRDEPVGAEELETAISAVVESFPTRFDSPQAIAAIFAGDEVIGRDHDYWYRYRERVRGVSAEGVTRVAREYLDPERMVVLMVGKWEEIRKGDPDDRASMAQFFEGRASELPLRDPLTLEPIEE